MGRAHTVI